MAEHVAEPTEDEIKTTQKQNPKKYKKATKYGTKVFDGEPNPPKLVAKLLSPGNELKVNWIKQDDGGSPIKQYLVSFRPKHQNIWKPVVRVPNGSEFLVLRGLDWNTEYEVSVEAENQHGRSQPGVLFFRTSVEPTAIPATLGCSCITYALVTLMLPMLTVFLLS